MRHRYDVYLLRAGKTHGVMSYKTVEADVHVVRATLTTMLEEPLYARPRDEWDTLLVAGYNGVSRGKRGPVHGA